MVSTKDVLERPERRTIHVVVEGPESDMLRQQVSKLLKEYQVVAVRMEMLSDLALSPFGCVLKRCETSSCAAFLQQCSTARVPLSALIHVEEAAADQVVDWMLHGALAVLMPSTSEHEISKQIQRAIELDWKRRRWLLKKDESRRRLEQLNEKERRVLLGVLEGLPNKLIAKKTQVSQRTVESRRHDIYAKTQTASLVDLMRVVLEAGWDLSQQSSEHPSFS